jgi:hypothetical protein
MLYFIRNKVARKVLSKESASDMRLKYGNGGWSTESLPPPFAYPDDDPTEPYDPHCDADMLDATQITPDMVHYFKRQQDLANIIY